MDDNEREYHARLHLQIGSEQKFWLGIWTIIGAVLTAVVLCITITHNRTVSQFTEMVKAGADPILLDCALWNESKAMCTARALTLKAKSS